MLFSEESIDLLGKLAGQVFKIEIEGIDYVLREVSLEFLLVLDRLKSKRELEFLQKIQRDPNFARLVGATEE